MDLSRFDTGDAGELRSYLEFLLWHYRVVDSFWFLYLAEEFGQSTAERMNERVWERVSALAARDLIKRFGITEKGLEGFLKVLRVYPWTLLIGYEIEQSADEVVITVPVCATQEARRTRGMGEYDCGEMHRREFLSLVEQVDPRIEVQCDFCPPGERPAGIDCRWRFRLAPGEEPEQPA